MSRIARRALLIGALLVACGEAPPEAPVSDEALVADSAPAPPAPPPIPVSRREPLPLTEREVADYVRVLEALARAGERMKAEVMADTLGVVINEGLLAASPAAQRIITGRGFRDLEHFHQVAYSIASALQAPEPSTLEAMPLPDDPEERKAIEEVRAAMGEFASTQPPGNAALVAAYRDRIRRAQAGP
jgi:hypothetical protein